MPALKLTHRDRQYHKKYPPHLIINEKSVLIIHKQKISRTIITNITPNTTIHYNGGPLRLQPAFYSQYALPLAYPHSVIVALHTLLLPFIHILPI